MPPISKFFCGEYLSTIKCPFCDYYLTKKNIFFILELPKEIFKDVFSLNNYLNNKITEENNNNTNIWKCNKCKNDSNPKRQIQLNKLPEILIIALKVKNDEKSKNIIINNPFNDLNINNNKFSLFGLIESNNNNNKISPYISKIKYENEDEWYAVNNSHIESISKEKIKDSFISNNAYILFYRKE